MALHSGKLFLVLVLVGLCSLEFSVGQAVSLISCPGPNEQYTDCGPVCGDRLCSNFRDGSVPCLKSCGSGCYCEPGYARNKSYKCIAAYLCPFFG
ncbi:chymotrypsin-elastase inhibitor ixodidin-like [Anopheles aquasalis]|uniref:chymotrypsin-elastase inhibitor ixodidin-like n=1 Tax=Anopheles aquasalis TaxID=42839 RepID=UPI00215B5172|nr:chymotrypsin-elastase inhibitor ixodidin-like [Anopheles aquasalis]